MNPKYFLMFSSAVAVALAGTAHAQITGPGVGPSNPNRMNQDLETMQQIRLLDEKRRLDEQHRRDGVAGPDQTMMRAQVAKFMEAIKYRKRRFATWARIIV